MKICEDLLKTAQENGLQLTLLPKEQSIKIKNNVKNKYLKIDNGSFIWENLRKSVVVSDTNGWAKLANYVKQNSCIIFFDENDEAISIKNGDELYTLIYEMYGFEFYITNNMTDYLLCFNHHDCIIGCGEASEWLENLKKRND